MKTSALKNSLLVSGTLLLLSFVVPADKALVKTLIHSDGDSAKLSKEQLLKFCGEYLPTGTDPRMTQMSVVMYKDILYRHVNDSYVAINPVSAHKFVYDDNSGRSLDFVSDKNGKVTEVIVARKDGEFRLRKNPDALMPPAIATAKTIPEQIAQLVEKYAEYGQFNGSVLVSQNGKVIYKKGFGMANIELGVQNQTDTKFRLASVSKQFTAMLVLQLVEKGKLDLHVPISTYLSDYPKQQGGKITLHHLLNHSSGIPNFTSFPDYETKKMRNHYTPEQLVHFFDTLPLEFEPGARFNYSNSGYVLLGYIIEKVSGKTYEQCLKDQIFVPLKMTNSGVDHNEIILPKRSAGYNKNGNTLVNASYIDMSVPYSAGALYSTVEDLYLWDQGLYMDALLSEKLRAQLFTNYFEGKQGNYGYGWGIYPMQSLRTGKTLQFTEHGGSINGFSTFISREVTNKHCVIALNNTAGANMGGMSHAIGAILFNQPYDMPKKSLAFALADLIHANGLKAGLSKVNELKSSGIYRLDEDEMNAVGYDFLNVNKTAEAIEIFKINVETFPGSANCYDSLGEAYLKNGDKKLAAVNYKKAVEMDPRNENAKRIIAEISK